jgi:hypothetical protein
VYYPNDPQQQAAAYAAYQDHQNQDQLNLLAIFHYVCGAVIALFSCFFLMHVFMGLMIMKTPSSFGTGPQGPPPKLFGEMFVTIGLVAVLSGWTVGGLTAAAGRCIATRRGYIFILVIAGINCLIVPIGTALGVCTFVVLLRPSVRALFDPGAFAPPASGGWPPAPGR